MFWKKKPEARPPETKAEAPKPPVEKPASQRVTLLTEAEIRQKIEQLTEPGSTAFFYLSGSSASGGPLGRGAAVVELNPNYPGKKEKKYNLHVADVEGMQPVGKGQRLFASDKPKELAGWIKERHYRSEPSTP